MSAGFKVGDQVFYVLPGGRNGRRETWYMRAAVTRVTKRRITVRPVERGSRRRSHRVTVATSLVHAAPAGACIV